MHSINNKNKPFIYLSVICLSQSAVKIFDQWMMPVCTGTIYSVRGEARLSGSTGWGYIDFAGIAVNALGTPNQR